MLYDEAVLNAPALQRCGFDEASSDGVVRGPEALRRCQAAIGPASFDARVASTRTMLRDLAALGLTGALDAGGIGLGPDSYKPIYEAWRTGRGRPTSNVP